MTDGAGPTPPAPRRVLCAGGVVLDAEGRLLVVRRGRPPDRGRWSLPGGRVEAGETTAQAVAREVAEETGLDVRVGREVGQVDRVGVGGSVYEIHDHVAEPVGGTLAGGDDADDARWVTRDQLRQLPTTSDLLETLTSWGVAPA